MREHNPHSKPQEAVKEQKSLADISVPVWLNGENAVFYLKEHFLHIKFEEKEARVFLCRQFPFELEWEYISVMDDEKQEIGIIRRLSEFDSETEALLIEELKRRYYAPVILRIHSMKERYGFSYWKVETPEGEMRFTLHDTYRSIARAGEHRLVISDVNGNRFQIPDTRALDRKSYRKIELYL